MAVPRVPTHVELADESEMSFGGLVRPTAPQKAYAETHHLSIIPSLHSTL